VSKCDQSLSLIDIRRAAMKIILVALFALALASAFLPAPIYAQGPPPGPYIQIPIPGIPGVGPQRREEPGYDREH
jgi:hypothetical protein